MTTALRNLRARRWIRCLALAGWIGLLAACSIQPEPPKDWNERIIVYKSLSSETGYAGYYVSYQEKRFLTFGQFLSAIPGAHRWKQQDESVWELTVNRFDMDLNSEGPLRMYFKIEESPSGNVNVLLAKAVTEDFEIPWILLDQIVMQAGETFNQNAV